MSLVFCPECGHEVSQNAIACPNCGLPLQTTPPVVEKKVVVQPPVVRRESFPPWAWVPIVVAGILVVFALYLLMRNPDDSANTNVSVNARRADQTTGASNTSTVSDTSTVSVPPTDVQTVTVPGSTTTVPGT